MHELEFIGPNDKPALLALSTPEWLDAAKNVLTEIGYKVHAASNHNDWNAAYDAVAFGRDAKQPTPCRCPFEDCNITQ